MAVMIYMLIYTNVVIASLYFRFALSMSFILYRHKGNIINIVVSTGIIYSYASRKWKILLLRVKTQ